MKLEANSDRTGVPIHLKSDIKMLRVKGIQYKSLHDRLGPRKEELVRKGAGRTPACKPSNLHNAIVPTSLGHTAER